MVTIYFLLGYNSQCKTAHSQQTKYILALVLKKGSYNWFYYICEIPGAHLAKVPTSIFKLHGMPSSDVQKHLPQTDTSLCSSFFLLFILPSFMNENRGRLIFTQPHLPSQLGRDGAQDEDHACDSVCNSGWFFKLGLQLEQIQPVQGPEAHSPS